MEPSRRGFVGLLGVLFAAPAIVRVASIMSVKVMPDGVALKAMAHPVGCPNCPRRHRILAPRLCRMRDAMLPGLRQMRSKYKKFPSQFDSLFKQEIEINERKHGGRTLSVHRINSDPQRAD